MSKPETMRIQKYFSEKGIASRRKTEEWMKQGYVLLNGEKVTEPGVRFDPSKDTVTLDPQAQQQEYFYYLFNKPKNIVTVNAQKGEKEILDIVSVPKGVVTVGRLDKDSIGLIMLTNDGVAARRLMEPCFAHEKEYEVSFFEPIDDEALKRMSEGMFLGGVKTKSIKITRLSSYKIRMVLTEGKNRQIRKMCSQVGFAVKKLVRVRLLSFTIQNMKPGELKRLSKKDIEKLYENLNLKKTRSQ